MKKLPYIIIIIIIRRVSHVWDVSILSCWLLAGFIKPAVYLTNFVSIVCSDEVWPKPRDSWDSRILKKSIDKVTACACVQWWMMDNVCLIIIINTIRGQEIKISRGLFYSKWTGGGPWPAGFLNTRLNRYFRHFNQAVTKWTFLSQHSISLLID